MRQITFGPTHTNYFDIDQDDDREGGNQSDRVDQDIIDRRARSVIASSRSHRVGSSMQNSPRANPPPYISRGSAFYQNFNSSVGAGSQRGSSELIFFAGEDLYRDNIVGTRELAIKKYCKCKLEFDDSRTYESYCHEFCGLLNLRLSNLKFVQGRKEVPMLRTVKKPVEVLVYYNKQTCAQRHYRQNQTFENALGPAFLSLLEKGQYSDLEIIVNGESIHAHKCILIARSEKFRVMLLSDTTQGMKEQMTNKIVVENKKVTAYTYTAMLKWIYMGECEMTDNASEVIPLLGLTDEYLLPDLQKVCEDQIIDYMDCKTATEILTDPTCVLPVKSEQNIRDAAKSIFLEDYERMLEEDSELEERVFRVKGLMSELLTHKKKKVKSIRKRRSSIGAANEDHSSKKKVRFNISSTIYEDASAIQDESVSIIEPLSIYSNVSPPGELADVSFPHSTVSYNQSSSARVGAPSQTHQTSTTNHQAFSDVIADNEHHGQHQTDSRNLGRPASAGEFSQSRSHRPIISRSLI